MHKNAIKRKQLRRKFKRRAAVLAGAAIMTGAVLSGVPATQALAAEAPANFNPIKTEQALKITRPPGHGWHLHENSWPSADENQAYYKDGKIYYRSDNHRNEYSYYVNNPVDYVKDRAAINGFDPLHDSFSLLTITNRRALVEVRQHDTGKLYNVLLERTNDRDWTIIDVHAL